MIQWKTGGDDVKNAQEIAAAKAKLPPVPTPKE